MSNLFITLVVYFFQIPGALTILRGKGSPNLYIVNVKYKNYRNLRFCGYFLIQSWFSQILLTTMCLFVLTLTAKFQPKRRSNNDPP